MAKKLSTDFKLSVRTSPRIHEAFSHLVLAGAAEGLKFNGRKIGAEAALNAMLVEFLDKPKEEQREILRRNVPRFEAEMSGESSPSMVGLTGQAALDAIAESLPADERLIDGDPPKPRSGSSRSKKA